MPGSIRVLIVEDCENDAILLMEELASAGYRLDPYRVETREEMEKALEQAPWDLVIADYCLPRFSAPAALALLKEKGLDLPFLVMSGVIGEETAVAIMRAGAHDYFVKGHLARLPAAIERELAEAQVRRQRRETEARYRALFEQSPDGVLLIDPTTTRAVDFNDAACRHLGYSREEFSGLRIADYDATESETQIAEHVARVLHEGRADFETRHRTKAGEIRDVLVTVQLLTLAGQALLHCIFRDITEHHRADQLLRASEERYRRLLSAITTYVYSVTVRDGEPAATEHTPGSIAVTGYAPEEFVADPTLWLRLVHPEDLGKVDTFVEKVCRGEDVESLEHRIVRRDGLVRWVRHTAVPCRDSHGTVLRYDGLVEDITARKQAEDDLWKSRAELLAAGHIQQRLLPQHPPSIPGLDIAGALHPAEFTGGDYFDYVPMRDGSLGLVIADVAGHRYGSALLMASTRAYLRSLTQVHTSVVEILELANTIIVEESEDGYFVTLFLGRLKPSTGSFTYASAGHETAYVLDASGAIKANLPSTGLPLGVMPDPRLSAPGYCVLAPGDLLLLVTDGVKDAASPTGARFGVPRTLEVVRTHRHRPAAEIVQVLYDAICEFSHPCKPDDDITAIVVKVVAPPA